MESLPVLIEEEVRQRLSKGLAYANWLLEYIDQSQRVTHVAIAAHIEAPGHLGWRTQRDHDASPRNGSSMRIGDKAVAPVHLNPAHQPRAALRHKAASITEDLLALLRRQWNNRGL